MKKNLLTTIAIILIATALRNFTQLANKSIPLNPIEKSVKSVLGKLKHPTKLAYYSNTIEDGLYFSTQLVVAPHVLVKFGKEDTALFVIDRTKRDTLFNPHRLAYQIIDSAQSENVKSYLLIRQR